MSGDHEVVLDADKLQFPLQIRTWQSGDYFYPTGMTGKKKLSKFFKDLKWSLFQKKQALVLYSNNQVVWVVNTRLNKKFKANKSTQNKLKISVLIPTNNDH